MKALAMVDPMGHSGMEAADEYTELARQLSVILETAVTVEPDIRPDMLSNRSFALYVFDYGGMYYGCEDLVHSYFNELYKQIEAHPDSLFIIWSTYTAERYKEYMQYELGKAVDFPNLIVFCGDNWEPIQEWFGVVPTPKPLLVTPVDNGMNYDY